MNWKISGWLNIQDIESAARRATHDGEFDMPQDRGSDHENIEVLAQQAIQDIDLDEIDSPVMQRLLQDIRGDSGEVGPTRGVYNRMHNRHNRGR